jgi:hypothetical protein
MGPFWGLESVNWNKFAWPFSGNSMVEALLVGCGLGQPIWSCASSPVHPRYGIGQSPLALS